MVLTVPQTLDEITTGDIQAPQIGPTMKSIIDEVEGKVHELVPLENKSSSSFKVSLIKNQEYLLTRIEFLNKLIEDQDIDEGQNIYYELRADIIYSLLHGGFKYDNQTACRLTQVHAGLCADEVERHTGKRIDHNLDKLWAHFCLAHRAIAINPYNIAKMKDITINGTAKQYCEQIDLYIV